MLVYSVEEAIWFPESKKNRNKAVVHRITSQIKGCVLGWYKVALCTLFVQHCSENQQPATFLSVAALRHLFSVRHLRLSGEGRHSTREVSE